MRTKLSLQFTIGRTTVCKSRAGTLGVENTLHWSLDVTFGEENSRARTKNAAQNVATLRCIALNLIKITPVQKCSARQKRIFAVLDEQYLQKLLRI